MNNIAMGKFGEKIAKQYLENKGYKIIESNYYTREGEIDLICQKDNDLIFVEVKTRANINFGQPEESITFEKQHHLVQAVEKFLQNYEGNVESIRIDAISIRLIDQNRARIRHLKNIVEDFETLDNE